MPAAGNQDNGWVAGLPTAAAAERAARAEIGRTRRDVRNRWDEADPATKAWRDSIARWHLRLGRIYTDAFRSACADLKQTRVRDPSTGATRWTRPAAGSLEIAIQFLEADVMCFHSGYTKERLARRLARQTLTEPEQARPRVAVFVCLDRGGGWEFRAYCKLAAAIADDAMLAAFAARRTHGDEAVRRRAGWMEDAIASFRRDPQSAEPRRPLRYLTGEHVAGGPSGAADPG